MDKVQDSEKVLTQSNSRQQWSLLLDGELSDEQIADLLRKEDDLSTLQTYSLIGDVLRSSDLALAHVTLSQKEEFLTSFRERLKEEPLIFSPAVLPQSKRGASRKLARWGAWLAASGFAVMIMVGVVSNFGGTEPETQVIATGDPLQNSPQIQNGIIPAGVVLTNSPDAQNNVNGTASVEAGLQLVETSRGKVWRDPRLDAYINAHQRFSHNPSLFVSANHSQ